MKIIATSLFGDPIHKGHIECLNKAKQLGDYLVVFVDSDRKAIEKKGFVFMNENERANIIQNLKCVDEVIIVDYPIAEALGIYKGISVFAKGGDRTIDNLPQEEIEICKRNNIEIVCGLGEKVQSSSNLIDNYAIQKPWGKYIVLHKGLNYLTKRIIVEPKQQLSLQYHNYRDEFWTVANGSVIVTLNDYAVNLTKGNSLYIPKLYKHRISNLGNERAEIIEVQLGRCDEDDIVRIEDDYGRISEG